MLPQLVLQLPVREVGMTRSGLPLEAKSRGSCSSIHGEVMLTQFCMDIFLLRNLEVWYTGCLFFLQVAAVQLSIFCSKTFFISWN